MIYSIVIFRDNQVIHQETLRKQNEQSSQSAKNSEKLLLGMISAVRGIVSILSGENSGNKFECLCTPEFRLDYFETLTGYSFAVLSEAGISVNPGELRLEFEKLYNLLFIPLVIRNPLFHPRKLSGDLRDSCCFAFVEELRNHFKSFTRDALSGINMSASTPPQLSL